MPRSERKLVDLLRRLGRLQMRMDDQLAGPELRAHEWLALKKIRESPGPVSAIAEYVGLTPAALTRLMDHLEEQGMIERWRSKGDRRIVESEVKPHGLTRIRVVEDRVFKGWCEVLSGMSRGDLEDLTKLVGRLVDKLEQQQVERTNGSPSTVS